MNSRRYSKIFFQSLVLFFLLASGAFPVNARATTMYAAISSGGIFTCALTGGGGVKCWGDNTKGQLGNGTNIDSSVPVYVSGLSSNISKISSGGNFACAVTNGGGVKCWGSNSGGQLGNGTNTDSNIPVNVSGLTTGVIAISAGHIDFDYMEKAHTCALTSDGGIKCWGLNDYGQLGNGTNTNSNTPVNVSGLTTAVIAISTGSNHTCALTSGGGVKCWGANNYGQLGNGKNVDSDIPVDVKGLTTGVIAISTGDIYTCALTDTAGVKCWGDNTVGQLGNGAGGGSSYLPVDVSGLTNGVSAISTGGWHTCALTSVGGVKCWGSNGDGRLGNGTDVDSDTPVDVSGLTSGVSAIATGGYHTCALTTAGGIKCWGTNQQGVLGNGKTANKSTPVNVIGLTSGVSAISAGTYYTCALTTGGGAKCWGSDMFSELGDVTFASQKTPVDVSELTSGVIAISAGTTHTCALTSGGGAKCWGWGILGNGTNMSTSNVPVNVSGLTSDTSAISIGYWHACALTSGGGVKCWGMNGEGELGDGTNTDSNVPVNAKYLSSGISAISAGGLFNCALTSAGGVKCWGDGAWGQLGNGANTNSNIRVNVSGLTSGISAISAGETYSCALTSGGGVKCWGMNDDGQLGDGTNTGSNVPINVSGLTNGISAVAAGQSHTCALTSSGGVKCWGSNKIGQLGDGTTTSRLTPVDVKGLTSGVIAITAGGGHTCALTSSGGIKCWGNNQYGQLGDGGSWSTTPVDVVDIPDQVFVIIKSIGANDGWILESSEFGSKGGSTRNSAATTFRLGDDAARRQYRGVLSFNTGADLPDDAGIAKVTLNVKRQGITGGGNPVITFKGFMVDVKNGFFGTTAALQSGDFQAKAGASYGPFNPAFSGGGYSIDLTNGSAYINKLETVNGGLTQIRLRFKWDDNNNGVANYLSLFSGNADAASQPQLIIEYYVP